MLLKPVPTLKPKSRVPSAFSLAMRGDDVPLYDENAPPTRILPSVWIAILLTLLLKLVPISKLESRVPSAFSLAMRVNDVPLYVVNVPPTRIFPSD